MLITALGRPLAQAQTCALASALTYRRNVIGSWAAQRTSSLASEVQVSADDGEHHYCRAEHVFPFPCRRASQIGYLLMFVSFGGTAWLERMQSAPRISLECRFSLKVFGST